MSINTLKFVQRATNYDFTGTQAEFLSAEINKISKRKIGKKKLTSELATLKKDLIIWLGAIIIGWTTIALTVLGFIIKN